MSKCRYDLTKDCNKTDDCIICVLAELQKSIDERPIDGEIYMDDDDRWGYEQGYQSADADTVELIQRYIDRIKGETA